MGEMQDFELLTLLRTVMMQFITEVEHKVSHLDGGLHRGTAHVISRMRNDDLHRTGNLEANISKTLRDRGLVTMGD